MSAPLSDRLRAHMRALASEQAVFGQEAHELLTEVELLEQRLAIQAEVIALWSGIAARLTRTADRVEQAGDDIRAIRLIAAGEASR